MADEPVVKRTIQVSGTDLLNGAIAHSNKPTTSQDRMLSVNSK